MTARSDGIVTAVGATYPPAIAALPAALRTLYKGMCKGDWSRVTIEPDGSIVVHNNPHPNGLGAASPKKPIRKSPNKRTNTSAPPVQEASLDDLPEGGAILAPRVSMREAASKPQEPVSRPEPVEVAQTPASAPVRPPVTRREVAQARKVLAASLAQNEDRLKPAPVERVLLRFEKNLRIEPTIKAPAEARYTTETNDIKPDYEDPYEETPAEGWDLEWEPVPGVRHEPDWKAIIDLQEGGATAFALLKHLGRGVGSRVPILTHGQVDDLWGIDIAGAKAVARDPAYVEVDISTATRGYPVLRFIKGDLMAVVGFRHPGRPMLIAAYYEPLLCHLYGNGSNHDVNKVGGGGSRKEGGLPKSPNAAIARLQALGAEVPQGWQTSRADTVEVTFKGEVLGKMTIKPHTPRQTVQSDYQRIFRRWNWLREQQAKKMAGVG